MDLIILNELAKSVHKAAKEKGFYDTHLEFGTRLMLITSELSEALEADRCYRHADMPAFEECLEENVGEIEQYKAFQKYIKDTVEDEIADTFIRLLDLCGYMAIDIEKHIKHKLWYNEQRPRLHGKCY